MRPLAVALAAVAAVTAVLALPGSACACSCVEIGDAAAFEEADVVFEGTLVDIDDGLGFGAAESFSTLEFEVDAVYKGAASERQGVVTVAGGSSCDFAPPVGADYLMFLYEQDDALHVSMCGGSRPADEPLAVESADAAAPLAGSDVPASERDHWLPVSAVLVVAAVAALWWRWRRRA